MQGSRQNVFGNPSADRRTIQRSDDNWIREQQAMPQARFVVMSRARPLMTAHALTRLPRPSLPQEWIHWQSVFLGMQDDAPVFALSAPDEHAAYFGQFGEFAELRTVALTLDPADAALTVHARAVLHWHSANRYCGSCGRELECAAGGHARRCLNTTCEVREFYPRIDPAVIVLVTHEDHCLLGRQAVWPPNRYSCLAGFTEAGETLEEAVRREVLEESGVAVEDIRYHSSQPWPFPQSLMIGFTARALAPDITLHDDELEEARWFSRTAIRAGLESGELKLSAPLSIAFRLIRDWYANGADPALLDEYAKAS